MNLLARFFYPSPPDAKLWIQFLSPLIFLNFTHFLLLMIQLIFQFHFSLFLTFFFHSQYFIFQNPSFKNHNLFSLFI